ncbi:MAG: hypothetical protein ABIY70_22795 [Capsulimonas sp.]|uniref:hypothetical protein n=1 Tax=Capsulimonas sp. TaxID=2494211 RepID=UPI003266C230
MTNYYVRKTGSNAVAGTSVGAAWLTVTKAIGPSGTTVGGDVVYLGAGIYRETVTVSVTPASVLRIVGDVDGAQTGDLGEVVWTAYTTNDQTTPATVAPLNMNGKSFLQFEKIRFVGANAASTVASIVNALTLTSTNITFLDCTFEGVASNNSSRMVLVSGAAGVTQNILFDRCLFKSYCPASVVFISTPTSTTGADWDVGIEFRNCRIDAGGAGTVFAMTPSASGNAFKPGGLLIRNCTVNGGGTAVAASAGVSTTVPIRLENSVIVGAGTGISVGTAGQVIDNYTLICANTPRTAGTAGANSQAGPAWYPNLQIGHEVIVGQQQRPYLYPGAGSNVLGFGADATYTAPAYDLANLPRPSGGGSILAAAGCFERHGTGVGSAANADGGVGKCLKITGPGDQDFQLAVDAVSTVITVKVLWDSGHGDTNKPQASLLANAEIGYAGETKTATVTAPSAYETLTFTAFTPTAKGVVTLRLFSRSASGTGNAYFDTVTRTP